LKLGVNNTLEYFYIILNFFKYGQFAQNSNTSYLDSHETLLWGLERFTCYQGPPRALTSQH
jgi:3',5'-cyclic AMP phosphodiesterase CpdA